MRIAYYPLHYGKEFLEASIKSIRDNVDAIYLFYSKNPSQGHVTNLQNPDTRLELMNIAYRASNKCIWKDGDWRFENQHRQAILEYAKQGDIILAVDADEVWDEECLSLCLEKVEKENYRWHKVDGFINFWTSFEWACYDGFRPYRFMKVGGVSETEIKGRIFHFSLAQSVEIMRYKYSCFGHASEIRKGYIDEIYLKWKPGNKWLHPVSLQVWEEAQAFDKNTLPEILKQHPNFNKSFIK